MRRLLAAALLAALSVRSARAWDTPDAAFSRASAAFRSLAGLQAPRVPPGVARRTPEAAARPVQRLDLPAVVRPQGAHYLHLHGYVNLNGSGFIPRGSGWATITVSGWTNLQDQDGHYLNGDIRFDDTSTYFVSGNYVSGWAHPYAYVNVYDNGKLLGTTRVSGTVSVSGFRNGDWLNLSGSGFVDGDLTYSDDKP